MTRHRLISRIHKLAFGTLATIALFCSCRSSDIATRESSSQNRMQETVSQDSVHVSQLRFDFVIVERYFTVETIRDTVYIKQESNKQHFSILHATAQVLLILPHLHLRLHLSSPRALFLDKKQIQAIGCQSVKVSNSFSITKKSEEGEEPCSRFMSIF